MAQRKVNCEVYTDRGIVGKEGAEGKSAYQQAVEGGYQGTEEEFEQALASDISVVADNVTNINVVGNNIENVNTAVDNMSAIIAAPTAATQAAASASQAATSATNAQTSETNAATSASNAATSATNASASATISTTKASEATSSATSASASANSASESATSASTSAANAEIWAEGTDAQVTTLGGEHSSKGWANVSKQYAESIGAALKYKGSVSTYSALPSTGQEIGDTWNVLDTGDNYAWTGTEWDKLSGTVDLSAYRTSADQDIIDATKQDTISDLSTIREGAALGATSVQPEDLATVATSGSYNDLTNKPTIPTVNNGTLTIQKNGTNVATFTANQSTASTANIEVPTKLSELTDDLGSSPVHTHSQYSTVANTVSNVVAGSTADKINVTKNGSTSTITINNVANATNATKATQDGEGNTISTTYAKKSTLATVATSGSYTDLTNKPTIPAAVTETTVSGWGFTKNAGTVTSVKINGTAKNPTSGVVDLGTVLTAHQDISGKQDVISDLATIRSGASAGATAVQHGDLATVATSGMYSDLTGTPGVATANTLGLVKPDGNTITVTEDGTISAAISGEELATKAELQAVDSSKADTNLGNIPSNYDYVVESQVNADGSWYRKYKSGWLEQGGSVTGVSQSVTPYTLLKPFAGTNYKVLVSSSGQNMNCWIGSKTTTTVVIQSSQEATYGVYWYACGQGA